MVLDYLYYICLSVVVYFCVLFCTHSLVYTIVSAFYDAKYRVIRRLLFTNKGETDETAKRKN